MGSSDTRVDRNYERFHQLLPELLRTVPGRFVLMHNEQPIEFFDTSVDAVTEGLRRFGEGKYSVQKVASEPENLGFYSYAGGALQA